MALTYHPLSPMLKQPAGSFEGERHPNGISPHAPSNGAATTASTGERPNVGVNYTVGVGLEHDGGGRERFDKNDGDDDDLTREMTRKWLQGFSAEDILRDKNLLRQQLEVRKGDASRGCGCMYVWGADRGEGAREADRRAKSLGLCSGWM